MSNDTIEQVLRQEAAALEKELAESPCYQRLKIIQKTLSELSAISPKESGNGAARLHRIVPTRREARLAKSFPQATEFALNAAGHPLTTKELIEILPKYGKTPSSVTALSNNLSANKKFSSVDWRDTKAWWFEDKEVPE